MFKRNIKTGLFTHKIVLVGFIFALLMVVFLCGHISIIGNMAAEAGAECSIVFLGNNIHMKDSTAFFLLLFSFIALVALLKNNIRFHPHHDISLTFSRILLKLTQLVHKLYNPILKAFRLGILHPQIYNFARIAS